jgi:glucokinase
LPANSASGRHRLLGDIGATNVRFALLSNGVLGPIKWFTVADFPRFTDAVNAFLDGYCRQVSVCEALLAVAGPVDKDRCVLINSAWTIDAPELCEAFSFAKVHILNDFEATALSLPLLTAADLYPVGDGETVLGAPMVVLGPGTGLGVACFVPGSGGTTNRSCDGQANLTRLQ